MACYLYNNRGYACGGCVHFVRSTAVTLTGTVLSITIPEETLKNHQRLCLCIAQSIPDAADENTTVSVVLGTQEIPVITRCGNHLYADQIKSRQVLKLFAATDIPYFVTAQDCHLCKTKHVFPTIPTPTPAANETAAVVDTKKGGAK